MQIEGWIQWLAVLRDISVQEAHGYMRAIQQCSTDLYRTAVTSSYCVSYGRLAIKKYIQHWARSKENYSALKELILVALIQYTSAITTDRTTPSVRIHHVAWVIELT